MSDGGFGIPGDYNIQDELKMRKVLERNSRWEFEFSKTEDPYWYDMSFYKWEFEPVDGWIKRHYGYIELERADEWTVAGSDQLEPGDIDPKTIFPDNWQWGNTDIPKLTFLKRKVFEYDRDRQRFEDVPKEDYEKTVLLKFDNSIQECFAVPLVAIKRDGWPTPRSDDTHRNEAYLALQADHQDVYLGLDNVMVFIDEFMGWRSDEQSRLDLDSFAD